MFLPARHSHPPRKFPYATNCVFILFIKHLFSQLAWHLFKYYSYLQLGFVEFLHQTLHSLFRVPHRHYMLQIRRFFWLNGLFGSNNSLKRITNIKFFLINSQKMIYQCLRAEEPLRNQQTLKFPLFPQRIGNSTCFPNFEYFPIISSVSLWKVFCGKT